MSDPLRNPKDPINGSAPPTSLDLFRALTQNCRGRPTDQVMDAAGNLLVNAIRQSAADWRKAEVQFDDLFGRFKQLLKNHYDVLGRKRGVFPYDQVISPPLHVDDDKFKH